MGRIVGAWVLAGKTKHKFKKYGVSSRIENFYPKNFHINLKMVKHTSRSTSDVTKTPEALKSV